MFISTISFDSCNHSEDCKFVKNHYKQIIADLAIFATISTVAGLILGRIIHIGIPISVGTLGHKVLWGVIIGACSITVVDTAFLIKHMCQKRTSTERADDTLPISPAGNRATSAPQHGSSGPLVSKMPALRKRKAIFRPFTIVKNLLATQFPKLSPRRDYLTQELPSEIFINIINFLDTKDIDKLRLVNKFTNQIVKDSARLRALEGGWFTFSQRTKFQAFMNQRLRVGYHSVYLKLNDSKESVAHFIIDKTYVSREELTDTYHIECEIQIADRVKQIRFTDKTFWVEAREFRTNVFGSSALDTYGKYIDADEDRKIKKLFFNSLARDGSLDLEPIPKQPEAS